MTANFINKDTQDHPDEAPFIDYEAAGFFNGGNYDFYHFNQEYAYAEWRNYRTYVGQDSTFVVHDLAYYDYDSVCNVVYDTVTHNDTLWYVVHDTVYVAQDANFVAERNGYLYANYLPTTLSFTGYLYTCAKKEHRYLRYDSISPNIIIVAITWWAILILAMLQWKQAAGKQLERIPIGLIIFIVSIR